MSSIFSRKAGYQFTSAKLKGTLLLDAPTISASPSPSRTSLSPPRQLHQQPQTNTTLRSRKVSKQSIRPSRLSTSPIHSNPETKWLANGDIVLEDEAHPTSDMAAQKHKLNKAADAKLPSSRQRRFLFAFFVLAVIRLHFALSSSYIHPDEHFQGPEVVVGISLQSSWRLTAQGNYLGGPLFHGSLLSITRSTVQ